MQLAFLTKIALVFCALFNEKKSIVLLCEKFHSGIMILVENNRL